MAEFYNRSFFKYQAYSYRRKFNALLTSSVYGFIWQMLQLVLTLISCETYIQVLYMEPDVPDALLYIDVILTTLFAIDFVFNFYAAQDRLRHLVLQPYAFVDWITVIPFYVSWASGDPFNTDTNQELFVRSLRLFRSIRIIRCYRLLPVSKNALVQQIIQVVISFFILVFISTSLIQFLEDNLEAIPGLSSNAPFDWYEAFYFIIVTFSTVGYGDISPTTYAGRGVMIFFILLGIAVLPYQIGKLIEVIGMVNKYELTAYTHRKHQEHLIVMGHFDARTLIAFFDEWYQRCHRSERAGVTNHMVLVSSERPSEEIEEVCVCVCVCVWVCVCA